LGISITQSSSANIFYQKKKQKHILWVLLEKLSAKFFFTLPSDFFTEDEFELFDEFANLYDIDQAIGYATVH